MPPDLRGAFIVFWGPESGVRMMVTAVGEQKSVAVLGASGYGGVEFLRLVSGHPNLEVAYCGGHTSAGERLGDLYPHLPAPLGDTVLGGLDVEAAAEAADILVFCLPHAAGTDMIAQAYDLGKMVVDFSADYRLKNVDDYEAYYSVTHTHPELLQTAVYGLPELHRAEIAATRFIAVPGCYPTSVILGFAPAVKAGIIDTGLLIADSKSGVSGAGRGATLTTHFSEVTESFSAYKVASHRHTPEMDQELGGLAAGDSALQVTFVPHLVPQIRGILSTCYGVLKSDMSVADVHEVYSEFYADEPFVNVHPLGKLPATKYVTGTNRCDIGVAVDPRTRRLVAVAVIDNLTKGLAGAAVQCINLACGWAETTGLPTIPCWP